MMPRWRIEFCAVCGTPLPERLLLVIKSYRGDDDAIMLVSPAEAKVCDEKCLRLWCEGRRYIREVDAT